MANQFTNITLAAPTTTTIADNPVILSKITVNKAAVNGVITVYNGTAAENVPVAIITCPATLLQNHFTLDYDIYLNKGLVVVTSVAAQDITVSYRTS